LPALSRVSFDFEGTSVTKTYQKKSGESRHAQIIAVILARMSDAPKTVLTIANAANVAPLTARGILQTLGVQGKVKPEHLYCSAANRKVLHYSLMDADGEVDSNDDWRPKPPQIVIQRDYLVQAFFGPPVASVQMA
jgi:hypothetical protein